VGSRPGQATLFQQLPQQLGVGRVGRGPPLGATQGRGLGRLGQVRLAPGGLQLLDHEPPARARLHRERPVMVWQLHQPSAQPLPGRRCDLASLGLAGGPVDPVKGDLPPMHVQSSYDAHRDLLRAPPIWLQHDHPCLSRRRSLHIASSGGPAVRAAFGRNLSLPWLPPRVVWQTTLAAAPRST
jgi:hypothetical protein